MYLYLSSRTCLVTISVILVDFASQAAINPCESLMADTIHNAAITENPTSYGVSLGSGFKVYSYMIALGSCVGYLLGTIDWTKPISRFTTDESIGGTQPLFTPEQSAFILVTVLFSTTALITMISAREIPNKHNNSLANHTENSSDKPRNLLEKTSDRHSTIKFNNLAFSLIRAKFISENKCRKQIQVNTSLPLLYYFIHLIFKGINLVTNYCIYTSQYIICVVIMVFVYIVNLIVILITKVSKMLCKSK